MSLRSKFWFGFIPVAALGLALVAAGIVFVVNGDRDALDSFPSLIGFLIIGGGFVLLLLMIWVLTDVLLLRPLQSIERGAELIVHGNTAHALDLPPRHALAGLQNTVQELGDSLHNARTEVARAVASEIGSRIRMGADSQEPGSPRRLRGPGAGWDKGWRPETSGGSESLLENPGRPPGRAFRPGNPGTCDREGVARRGARAGERCARRAPAAGIRPGGGLGNPVA